METQTFAAKLRDAARGLREFTVADLGDAIGCMTYQERATIRQALRDFLRRGEFLRVNPGVYRFQGRQAEPTKRQRLWNTVRRMPQSAFSLDDLEQITGIGREYCKEFCSFLVRDGYARRIRGGRYHRAGGMGVEVPPDRKAIQKYRAIRKSSKMKAQR